VLLCYDGAVAYAYDGLWPRVSNRCRKILAETRYRIAGSTVDSFHQTSNVSYKTSCNLLLQSPKTRSSISKSAPFTLSRTAETPNQREIVRCSGLLLPAPSSCMWNADALPLRSEGHVELKSTTYTALRGTRSSPASACMLSFMWLT
jgi:hypothetical protein